MAVVLCQLHQWNTLKLLSSISQSNLLWRSYPAGFTFGLVDFDSDGSVYLLKNSAVANDVELKECSNVPGLLKSSVKLSPNLSTDGTVFYCGPNSLTCETLQSLGSITQRTGQPIMIEKIAHEQWELNLKTFPGLEKFYSQTDVSAYLSAHEMFHIYQMGAFKDFHYEFQGGLATTGQCYESVPSWAEKLEHERGLIRNYLRVGYSPSREQAFRFIQELAKIRAHSSDQENQCRKILEREERIEGAAHYLGNLFLQKYKRKSAQQLSNVDLLFLKSDIKTTNWLHAYVSGGLILRALMAVDATKKWEDEIEAGETPFRLVQKQFTDSRVEK